MSTSGKQARTSTPTPLVVNEDAQPNNVVSTKTLKVSTPETFDGSPKRLEDFLMQVRLYILFNSALFSKDSDKVLYASSYLRGKAARGFRTYLKDWLDNQDPEDVPSGETKLIFEDYSEFENKLTSLYGIANEEANTDREIRKLR